MDSQTKRAGGGLFTLELLLAAAVFVCCAAVCLGLLVKAETMSRESDRIARAIESAQSVSECFRASGGALEQTAALCGGAVEDGCLTLAIDGDLLLYLSEENGGGPAEGLLSVEHDGQPLLSWRVAAPEAAP